MVFAIFVFKMDKFHCYVRLLGGEMYLNKNRDILWGPGPTALGYSEGFQHAVFPASFGSESWRL